MHSSVYMLYMFIHSTWLISKSLDKHFILRL